MSSLSDSDHHSDQEKVHQLVEDNRTQTEKPKVADTRKRPGRPRKSNKSPKRGHRTSDENLKNGKPRSRTRTVVTPGKKKQPKSKETVTTSDDDSDSRSQSDSDSDRRPTKVSAVAPTRNEKKSRLSLSSSDDESLPPNRKNNNSASEDDAARWRVPPIKRNNLLDSPKKQDPKKNSTKNKPRQPRSRVTNVTGGSDSDSESEVSVRSNRIKVAR